MSSAAIVDTVKHKSHRERNAGRKAEKKKAKTDHNQILTDKQKNPKAFTFNSAIGAERRFRRKQDIDTKKQHIPLVDRTPLEPPPVLVAVVGPPSVGKSLLMKCLIKSYARQPLTNVVGPVTVVSGKKRRITFIECKNDLNSMIDIAKVADLVLLLVDASFGFEMEIFEFLNICQVHGMPKIIGVLTHLDLLKNAKALRTAKKTLKHRFWTEVYEGAKLFHLSGMIHDEYLRTEVNNLGRFISVMKFRPLTWRTTHSHLLVDRVEDLTPPELIRKNSKVDRTVSLYGYVRGVPLNKENSIHIPGCGDFKIKDVSFLPDPCPLPEQIKKRRLVEKERLIYAPFSGVGGIVYDKDAVYVELGGSHSHKDDDNKLIANLMKTQYTLDQKLARSEIKLFSNSEPMRSEDYENNSASGFTIENVVEDGRTRRRVVFGDIEDECVSENEDDEDDEENEESEDDEDNEESEDDNEEKNVDEDEEGTDEFIGKRKIISERFETEMTKKKRKTDYSDVIDDYEKELASLRAETTNGEPLDVTEEPTIYRSTAKESDIRIKNKINEVLNMFDDRKAESDTKNDSEDENSANSDEELKWKRNLSSRAETSFSNHQRRRQDLMGMVYGLTETKKSESPKTNDVVGNDEEIGGIFRVVSEQQRRKIAERELKNQEESDFYSKDPPRDWSAEENRILLMNRFVTGRWKESEDAEELLKLDDMNDDDEVYGDFEDLETGKKHEGSTNEKNAPKELTIDEKSEKKKLMDRKRKLKEQFDSEYDNNETKSYYDDLKQEVEKQSKLNKSEFEGMDDDVRVQLEGFRPGMYVRVEIDSMYCEFIENLDASYPIIIGSLLHGEENVGYVQTRIKLHRWYPKILKTRDPIIISVGWRRFQTIAVYSKLEDDMKNRMLKYTPKHLSCMATFWGPITPQGTGILAVQNVGLRKRGFRIAATGVVVEQDKTTKIVKKLKLIGTPMKIYKKTAFIIDMFNSSLEVAKFEGAMIKTVSGIRGQIKKAVSRPEGCFRATFEDKIRLSDIVFCPTWYKVDVPEYYNPVCSLLLPIGEKDQWRGMRTVAELKRDMNIKTLPNSDSLYKPIVREPKIFKPLVVPKSLQNNLPYKDKPKLRASTDRAADKRVAVVREPKEMKVAELMKMIRANHKWTQKKLKEAAMKRMADHKAQMKAEEMKKFKRQKELKKQVFRKMSKMDAKNAKKRDC